MADHGSGSGEDYVTKASPQSVADTAGALAELVEVKGLRLFGVIDQGAEARRVGLELRDTVLVLFGNPASGTPVMESAPLAALDLPLKALVWADGTQTSITYLAPTALAARHGLSAQLAAPLSAVDTLTDELVERLARVAGTSIGTGDR